MAGNAQNARHRLDPDPGREYISTIPLGTENNPCQSGTMNI